MFIASLYFLYLQAFVLHAFCPFCLFSAAMTFLLAGLLLAFPAVVEATVPANETRSPWILVTQATSLTGQYRAISDIAHTVRSERSGAVTLTK